MQLGAALGLGPREVVAFVGAGGKTSALYRLAQELLEQGATLVATTTTHVLPPPGEAQWPLVITKEAQARLQGAASALARGGRAFVASEPGPDGKLVGVAPEDVEALSRLADLTLVEADGARGRWVKAPAEHEPAIPGCATLVVPVAGLQALGRPLAAPAVHRPEWAARALRCPVGTEITEDMVARLLCDERGGLRGVPPHTRVVALCNQADSPERLRGGRRVAAMVLQARAGIRRVVVGAAQAPAFDYECWEPASAVVLAAGAGKRYGRPKLAMEWEGTPLVSRAVTAALSSLASEVLVVLGCQQERLAALLEGCRSQRLRQVVNRRWEEGLASTVGTAVDALDAGAAAAVFCNADQPLLSGAEIDALLIRHASTKAPIVAPRCRGQLRSPVLFGRSLFAELAGLAGDVGGRAVLDRHRDQVEWVDVVDPLPYEDIDTHADYLRLWRKGAHRKKR